MFKVLLKIEKVSLKIKQQVDLHIIIRKEHKFFTHCRNQHLKNGEAFLSNSSEFLIDSKSPKFEIELFLVSGDNKKKGGVVLINLKAYAINSSHRVVEVIKKTPLLHSTLALQFVYMQSEHTIENQSLISLQKAEELVQKSELNGVVDKHERLVFQNNSLNNELSRLKQKNVDLKKKQADIHETMQESQQKFNEEMDCLKKIREGAKDSLDNEKQKIKDIVKAINATGNEKMMAEMDKIMNSMKKEE